MTRLRTTKHLTRWVVAAATALFLVLAGRGTPADAAVCAPGFTIRWVAGGANNLWENPDNWQDLNGNNRVPNPGDRVCAEIVGSNFTLVTITQPVVIRSIEAYLPVGNNSSFELAPLAGDPDSVAHGFFHNVGVLKGAGNLTVEGDLEPGTITGTGTITVAPGGTITIQNPVLLDDHRKLVNNATATWTSGDIHLKNGAIFENGGTLTTTADLNVVVDSPSPDQPKFHNRAGAVFSKTDDIGPQSATFINAPFDNDGDVDASDGKITISGGNPAGQTSTGDFGGLGGGIVEFPSTYTLGAGSHIDGRVDLVSGTLTAAAVVDNAGVLNVSGGTLNADGAVVAAGGVLNQSGGTLGGSGVLTVDGTLNWTGGSMIDAGTTAVGSGGLLSISPGTSKALAVRTIDNHGMVNWGDSDVSSGGGARILNAGTLTATTDRNIIYNLGGAQPTLLNTGTLQKTGGSGDTGLPGWFVENDGIVSASTGRIVLTSGDGAGTAGSDGVSAGDLNGNAGTIALTGGPFDLGSGSNVSGGCCVEISGTVNVHGTTVDAGATLNLAGGTVGGPGTLTVDGNLNWSGGSMVGTGTTLVAAVGRVDITSANTKAIASRRFENHGVIEWSDAGNLNTGSGAVIENAGTLSLWSDADILYNLGGALPTVHNTGTIRKVVGAIGASTEISAAVDNDGTIDVAAGTARLTNGTGVVSTGKFLVNSTTLELAGSFTVDGAATFGGTCCIDLTGTLDVLAAKVAPGATLRQLGSVTGTGTLSVNGTLDWSSGSMLGSGLTSITSTGTLNIGTSTPKAIAGRRLTNSGNAMWTAGTINSGSGALITNAGTFTLAGDNDLLYNLGGAQSVFRNNAAGTLIKSSSGISQLLVGIDNDGIVDVQAGVLRFGGATTSSQSGVADVDGVLEFTGGNHTLNGATAFTGPGTVSVNAGTVTMSGANTVALTRVAGGTLNLNGTRTLADLELSSGALGGSGSWTVGGTFAWTGGSLVGSGTLIVSPTGVLTISGPNQKAMAGTRLLRNEGTGTWSAGNISTGSGAQFLNTGTLEVTGDNTIAYSLGGAISSFRNAGTLTKTGTAGGATEFVLPFENDGVTNATAGPMRFRSGGPESTGDFLASNTGSLEFPSGIYTLGNGVNFGGCCVVFNGANVNVPSTKLATVDAGATLELSNGNLGGTGTVRVRGTLDWTGGAMVDAGVTDVVAGAVLNVEGPSTKSIAARKILNKGTLAWSGGFINSGSGAVINNSGLFTISGDNTLAYNLGGAQSTLTNTGTIRKTAAGGPGTATVVQSLIVNTSQTVDVRVGTLNFNGGTFNNTGSVLVRRNGILSTSGAFAQAAGKTLTIDVGGATPGAGLGRVDAGGPVTLNGTLAISRIAGFNPAVGETFQIMSFPSRSGTFAAVTGAVFGSKRFDVQYGANAVTLVVVPV